jgi:FKBP-type peptidyl-prolyl cis-trans isomerase FkpA
MSTKPYMINRTRAFLLCSSLPLLMGCFDELTGPSCTTTTLTQASINGDTVTLNTGLRYVDGLAGSGTPAAWCVSLVTHYTEYLQDGTRLSSTHDLDQPLAFTPGVGDLIEGYEQGVIGMRNGGTRRLIVPPHLGYGSEPVRNSAGEIVIPGNSTLIYDIEAFNIPQ